MTSKLQNIDKSLKDLMLEIDNGYYAIPKFQRDFVWKSPDILSLGDSIVRGYPISSLLLMPCNGNLQIGIDPLKTNGSKLNNDKSNMSYVLDGQQRITSIAHLFLNYDYKIRYYFDLLVILNEAFPDDGLLTSLCDQKIKFSESFCRSFPKSTKIDEEPTKHNYRFISGKIILEDKFGAAINKFLVMNLQEKDDEKYDKYLNYLSALFGAISSYGIPTTIISQDADLGLVCRVFEKVNSSGIKLTTFDLINAKSFDSTIEKHSGGFANYMTEDLKKYLNNNYSKELENVYKWFLGYNVDSEKFSDLGRIARIIFVYDYINNEKTPLITNHQMLSKKSEFWFSSWENTRDNFFKYMEWIAEEEIIGLCASSYFEYIGAILLNNIKLLNINCYMRYIKKQALSIGFRGHNFTKSDIETVEENIKLGKKVLLANEFEKEKIIPKINFHITSDELMRMKRGKIGYHVALYIMFYEKFNFFTQDLLGYIVKYNDFDEHHLIPKSQNKAKDDSYDSIVNITLLNKQSNRLDIKNKYFEDYMNLIKNTMGEEKFKDVCKSNLIPDFVNFNEDKFLKERSELLAQYFNKYFS